MVVLLRLLFVVGSHEINKSHEKQQQQCDLNVFDPIINKFFFIQLMINDNDIMMIQSNEIDI
ncbi:hypothetical protein DERF_010272 [Dermatophagoides farinae]|uniref:Uncharacterized protein n=1 Tax=Dermatophagoides farinae TaxID=6954 RepID=A0A922I0Y1_DERFA|nr:hypothetical protein DERF_010272 [Dermatophagoides farinae]